jgi:protein subunit release factor B
MTKIILPESDEELLAECEVETFRASGKGGQHVNKTESAVRLTHKPSGTVVTCRQERSQHRNKATCLKNLRRKIERLNHEPVTRIATTTPLSERLRRREAKLERAMKKRLRVKVQHDE